MVLFFDAAGTLIRLRQPVGQEYAKIGADFGFALDPAMLDQAFAAAFHRADPPIYSDGAALPECEEIDRQWWRRLLGQVVGPEISSAKHFLPFFEALYAHYGQPETWALYPEVLSVLAECHRHHRLFVLSNFDQRLLPILHGLGLSPFFEDVLFSTALAACKPSASAFTKALACAGCGPQDAMHVGDDPTADWHGARDAGLGWFPLDRRVGSLADLLPRISPV